MDYISSFILGYVQQSKTFISSSQASVAFTLISRKEVMRLGTRFFSRGIDSNGNVSNYVETEQILIFNNEISNSNNPTTKIFSYLQIRGSIPILWTQNPTLKYKPPVEIE